MLVDNNNLVLQAFGKKLPLILWTSTLTEYDHVENFLDKNDYIIQVSLPT